MAHILVSAFLVLALVLNVIIALFAFLIQIDFRIYVWFCDLVWNHYLTRYRMPDRFGRGLSRFIWELRNYRYTDYMIHFIVIAFCIFILFNMQN